MPPYVLLLRNSPAGIKAVRDDPHHLLRIHDAIERWEAKVLASFTTLGEWDQCTIFEAPDNFKAYRATLAQELGNADDTEILPAIDLALFERLISQSAETEGPFPWQIRWWARVVRIVMYDYAYGRWARRYFTECTVTGKEKFRGIRGPCIIVANHASHFDQFCLMKAIPWRIRSHLYFGAAADRWFLKGRKEIKLRPWYQSLVNGTYPIQRGGGSRTLDYPKWLLDQGANLMLFPEGTRARGRHLSRFKYGAAILALEKNVPVVPVYLAGLRQIRPPGSRESVPGPVAAHVLDPIRFEPGTSVPDATRHLYRVMAEMHEKALAGQIPPWSSAEPAHPRPATS